jgi:hypothetical protein
MYTPVRLSTNSEAPPEERVPLFYIDDVEYTAPKQFTASFALRYVNVVVNRGIDAGVAWLLENGLSPGGYQALLTHDQLEPEQLAVIVSHLQEMVAGAMDVPKGKLRSA